MPNDRQSDKQDGSFPLNVYPPPNFSVPPPWHTFQFPPPSAPTRLNPNHPRQILALPPPAGEIFNLPNLSQPPPNVSRLPLLPPPPTARLDDIATPVNVNIHEPPPQLPAYSVPPPPLQRKLSPPTACAGSSQQLSEPSAASVRTGNAQEYPSWMCQAQEYRVGSVSNRISSPPTSSGSRQSKVLSQPTAAAGSSKHLSEPSTSSGISGNARAYHQAEVNSVGTDSNLSCLPLAFAGSRKRKQLSLRTASASSSQHLSEPSTSSGLRENVKVHDPWTCQAQGNKVGSDYNLASSPPASAGSSQSKLLSLPTAAAGSSKEMCEPSTSSGIRGNAPVQHPLTHHTEVHRVGSDSNVMFTSLPPVSFGSCQPKATSLPTKTAVRNLISCLDSDSDSELSECFQPKKESVTKMPGRGQVSAKESDSKSPIIVISDDDYGGDDDNHDDYGGDDDKHDDFNSDKAMAGLSDSPNESLRGNRSTDSVDGEDSCILCFENFIRGESHLGVVNPCEHMLFCYHCCLSYVLNFRKCPKCFRSAFTVDSRPFL